MRRYKRILKEPSRELRRKPTPAEKALWERLRRKQIGGVERTDEVVDRIRQAVEDGDRARH